jgi:hypothetical protein
MLFSVARPILPGKVERARRLAEELEPHRAEYDALNAKYRVGTHAIWVSYPADGPAILVTMYDMDAEDLKVMRGRSWDPEGSAYDRWWLEWFGDVTGVDLRTSLGLAAPPEPIFVAPAG